MGTRFSVEDQSFTTGGIYCREEKLLTKVRDRASLVLQRSRFRFLRRRFDSGPLD